MELTINTSRSPVMLTRQILKDDVTSTRLHQQRVVRESLNQAFSELESMKKEGITLPDAHTLFD